MARTELEIENHVIGDDHPPFIIAEAGVHHYNSVEIAKTLIVSAKIAGVDAIKFQTYTANRLATRWAPKYWSDESGETQYEVFAERDKLGKNDYIELSEFAGEVGIIFLSTPFDPDSAALLNDLNIPAFKIASADLTNYPLLKIVRSFEKPVILSTGASTFAEIEQSLAVISDCSAPVALLHCSLSYPTVVHDANLLRIQMLRERFPDVVIGYSDHTQPQDSEMACPLSVALGARIIEKHFTLNKLLPADDHYHAVDQKGLANLVKNCADAYAMTKQCVEMTKSEEAARTYARRSIVAANSLPRGTVLSMSDIDCKRPGTGLSPNKIENILGKRITRNIDADELIKLEDLESIS